MKISVALGILILTVVLAPAAALPVIQASPEVLASPAGELLNAALADLTAAGTGFAGPVRLYLGVSEKARQTFDGAVLTAPLAAQEGRVRIQGQDVLLLGGDAAGLSYAVKAFLERQCGYRLLSPYGSKSVPQTAALKLPPADYRVKSPFPYRHVALTYFFKHPEAKRFLYYEGINILEGDFDQTPYAAQLPMRGPQCHTLFYYITPDLTPQSNPYTWKWSQPQAYFQTHPEWYSMNDKGQRVNTLQLCFSNPGLRAELTRRLLERIGQFQGEGLFNLSARDVPGHFCCCPACRALEQKYQTIAGPILDYLLEAAPQIRQRFPRALLSTIAYRKEQSEKPPVLNHPLPDNLVIIFAPIDDNFAQPLTHPTNAGTLANLQGWRRLAKHVWIWYYPHPYGTPQPYAACRRLAEDTRLFAQLGCDGVFYEQDALAIFNGFGFAELSLWLTLQFYQEPEINLEIAEQEFCRAYYGNAADRMLQYLGELEARRQSTKVRLLWNSSPLALGYTPAEVHRWQQWFDQMEHSVALQPELLEHVHAVRVLLDQLSLTIWSEYVKAYPGRPEPLLQRLQEYGEAAIRQRCTTDGKVLNERLTAFQKQLEDLKLRLTPPKPLPPPLCQLPESRIRQAIAVKANQAIVLPMKDAAFGQAITDPKMPLEIPFTCGVYDAIGRHFYINAKIGAAELVPDQFHLYKLGTAPVSSNTVVWLTSSWQASVNVSEFSEAGNPDKLWDYYVSLKFVGKGYSPKSTADRDAFYCDRVVLVEHR